MQYDIWVFFKNTAEKIQISLKSDNNKWCSTWPIIRFWSYLAHFFLEWEMFRTKVVEKIKTHFIFNNFFFWKTVLYGRMWKYIVELDRPQMNVWCMRFDCWITEATATHSEYVILIAFPLQQCLQERASLLQYTYFTYLLVLTFT
jgi:hypothetical protein